MKATTLALFLMALLAGCATTQTVSHISQLESIGDQSKILLMSPDVKYYILTAGGMPEPDADLTERARINFLNALTDFANERNANVAAIDPADLEIPLVVSYDKLHSAVGSTVLLNHFGIATLPAKGDTFDWGLGPGVKALGERYQADYALFSFYRDYQASGGRIAFAILAAAAGVGVPTTAEFGFASLVDLQSGDIVWFNKVDVGSGELKDTTGARAVIDTLFKGLPEG
jgi:hypothetical protein